MSKKHEVVEVTASVDTHYPQIGDEMVVRAELVTGDGEPVADEEVTFVKRHESPGGFMISKGHSLLESQIERRTDETGVAEATYYVQTDDAIDIEVRGPGTSDAIAVSKADLPRTLIVEGTGPTVDYEFEVSGGLKGIDGTLDGQYVGLDPGDRVDGNTATGSVTTEHDGFRFSGELTEYDFSSLGDVHIYIDGKEIDLGERPDAHLSGPDESVVDHELTFDASDSRADDGELTGYRWNFGDGTIESGGESASHTYEQTGSYTVTVTVENDDGLNDSAKTSVMVTDLQVDAKLRTDRPQTGEPIEVVAELADARGEPIEGQEVAFVKHTGPGGFWDPSRGGGVETTVEAVSDAEGKARARYQSTETGAAEILVRAGVAEDRVEFRIDDRAPDAVIEAPDAAVRPNESVGFEAGTPRDSDGTIASREWHVARDGETLASGTGPTFQVDFPAEGDYAISLEVTDESGRTGTATETVSVEERGAASVEIEGPETLVAGDHGKFDVRVHNPPGAPAEYHWEIDNEKKISAAPRVTHTFSQDGRHAVDVTVKCETGDVLKNDEPDPLHAVTVVNNRPEVELEASPRRVTPGATVELYAEASDPDDHGLEEYRWSGVDWSDGPRAGWEAPVDLSDADEPYTQTVEVFVEDEYGARGSDRLTVTVEPNQSGQRSE